MVGKIDLISLTADIVAAHVGNNSIAISDVPTAIAAVYGALEKLGVPPAPAAPEKPKGMVSARASIKPDYLVSMIDGKQYRTLKRHIARHGYTPSTYRETFGLPGDYPFVAPSYSEQRREMAKRIGLGRKPKALAAPRANPKTPKRG